MEIPSAVAAAPAVMVTSVETPLLIVMWPVPSTATATPAPAAVWIAVVIEPTVAVVPAPRPIVVLPPVVLTVALLSKVMV